MEGFRMKRVFMLMVMSFVLLGVISNSFAASEVAFVESETAVGSNFFAALGLVASEVIAALEATVVSSELMAAGVVAMDDVVAASEVGMELEAVAVPEAGQVLNGAVVTESEKFLIQELVQAIKSQDVEKITQFIESGVSLNVLCVFDCFKDSTPLMCAVINEVVDAVRVLLNAGADVNMQDGEGDRVLQVACSRKNVEIVTLLLGAGADINIHGKENISALLSMFKEAQEYPGAPFYRAEKAFAIADMLIFAGVDIAIKDAEGLTVIDYVKSIKNGRGEQYDGAGKIVQAVANRKLYKARVNGIGLILEVCTPLSYELVDIVKAYEVDEAFSFLQERERNLRKKKKRKFVGENRAL